MSKRKRDGVVEPALNGDSKAAKLPRTYQNEQHEPMKVQIITGSYERVLHGIVATVCPPTANTEKPSAQFIDSFLFNAHASAIRCLALSPPSEASSTDSPKVTLATGGTDERVNLYSLSAVPAPENDEAPPVPLLGGNKILENPKNREIGSLLHHSSSITSLFFPTRSKLLSAAEDNNIAVTRSRDWSVISTIKAPQPKVQGRPSGDTAPPGSAPSGVNDFAVHPSMKLMLSVGKGEKCMRLWNLVTGKKAGVLSFDKEVLQSVREGKYSGGEGKKIEWSPDGQEFAVVFERGVIIFGADSKPKSKALPFPLTKIHQAKYFTMKRNQSELIYLAVSTEDGRIMFYLTNPVPREANSKEDSEIPDAAVRAQVGGKAEGFTVRVKDFEILSHPSSSQLGDDLLIVAGSSDGAIRLWLLPVDELASSGRNADSGNGEINAVAPKRNGTEIVPPQMGSLLGSYETANRITCLKAFIMLKAVESEEEEPVSESGESFGGFSETSNSDEEDVDGDRDRNEGTNGQS